MPRREPSRSGRFSYDGLDRVVHEKARLGILTSLATYSEGLSFNDLKDLCSLTDGNLSRHLDVLREAGLIEIHKDFHKRRPQTTCILTAEGRGRYLTYIEQLAHVIRDAVPEQSPAAPQAGEPGRSADLAPA